MAKELVITSEKAQEVIKSIATEPLLRKELIKKCVSTQKLTDEELKDTRSGEKLNKFKCEFGKAINVLISGGYLMQEEETDIIKPVVKKQVLDKKERDKAVKKILTEVLLESHFKKDKLLDCAVKKCDESNFEIKDARSDSGRILSQMIESKEVLCNEEGIFALAPLTYLCSITPEEFVSHSVKMLKKWFKRFCGYSDTLGQVTDRPGDGGIDGIITGTDKMGFNHKIILQMKHRENKTKNASLADVCAFCGVLSADDATKGLFVTNAKFHQDTVKFAKKYKNKYFVLIDGEKWLKLAEECNYEIDRPEND